MTTYDFCPDARRTPFSCYLQPLPPRRSGHTTIVSVSLQLRPSYVPCYGQAAIRRSSLLPSKWRPSNPSDAYSPNHILTTSIASYVTSSPTPARASASAIASACWTSTSKPSHSTSTVCRAASTRISSAAKAAASPKPAGSTGSRRAVDGCCSVVRRRRRPRRCPRSSQRRCYTRRHRANLQRAISSTITGGEMRR